MYSKLLATPFYDFVTLLGCLVSFGLFSTNGLGDSLFETSEVATAHQQLVPCEVQEHELAFVQSGDEVARFSIDLV
ncbi:MAG: hypothetical protein AAFR71_09965 [Pseudomonadota bacterium]